jgi:hypothetical protein
MIFISAVSSRILLLILGSRHSFGRRKEMTLVMMVRDRILMIWMLLAETVAIRMLVWMWIHRSLPIFLLMGRQFWLVPRLPRVVLCLVLLLLHL